MKKEQSFFIRLLSDYLNGRKTNINKEQLNWDEILCYAHNHQLGGIVSYQYNDNIPLDYKTILNREMLSIIYIQMNRESEYKKIQVMFKNDSIPFFTVKGPTVATLYPNPRLRTMGDIDIIVNVEDRDRCHEIFLQNGYKCIFKQKDLEWVYVKNSIEFEIHDHLVYESTNASENEASFFNECWKYVNDGELDWNFHLLYLLFHLKKHMLNFGVGFRQFMDLTVVVQKKELNWQWIETKLEEMGLLLFAQMCYGFIERWFEVKAPIAQKIDDDFFEEATDRIFSNGVFGHSNIDNNDNMLVNRVRTKKNISFQMVMIAIAKIFPSMKNMKNIGFYNYLYHLPLLLPIAWVHRWLKILQTKGIRGVIRGIGSAFTSKERVAQRESYLQKWGLC